MFLYIFVTSFAHSFSSTDRTYFTEYFVLSYSININPILSYKIIISQAQRRIEILKPKTYKFRQLWSTNLFKTNVCYVSIFGWCPLLNSQWYPRGSCRLILTPTHTLLCIYSHIDYVAGKLFYSVPMKDSLGINTYNNKSSLGIIVHNYDRWFRHIPM